MRLLGLALALLVGLAAALVPRMHHVALDPDEPIAADHSLVAGRARTIFDFEPLLGAFDEPKPAPDLDDPAEFEARFELEKDWTDRSRENVAEFFGSADATLCQEGNRQRLIRSLGFYYDARFRQRASFGRRGPRAKAFIDQAWSSPLDQRIDVFARQLVMSGIIKARDLSGHTHVEFSMMARQLPVIADVCASLPARRVQN